MKNIITINIKHDKQWSAQEKKNVDIVIDFVQHLMNNHDFDYVRTHFMNSSYLQHNRNIADGIESIIAFVEMFAKRFPDYTYEVKRIIADGDLVVFHSHATIKSSDRGDDHKGMNIIDVWKVQDNTIVEHWDSIQPLDWFMKLYVLFAGGIVKNQNGVF